LILVTGATGFVGRAVLPRLTEAGHEVRVLLRPSRRTPRLPKGVPVQVSLSRLDDERGLRSALTGVDTVIHLSGAEWYGSEGDVFRVDAGGTRMLVEAAEAAGVTLGVVLQNRFRPASEHLHAQIAAGQLGDLAAVSVLCPWWRPQSYYDQPGRGTLERDGGGVLITQAIHGLDLMLSLTGPVAEVAAIAGTSALHRMETEDFVGAGLRFANGALGALMAIRAGPPAHPP
jgi:uncharacterized protein YbjT (DUF2867 family)